MKRYLLLLQYLVASIWFACDSPSISHEPEHVSANPGKQSSQQTGNLIRFKRFSYIDQQGTGSEAFSFLIPIDWKFNGGLIWLTDNPGMPATAAFKVSNPKGSEVFEVFPNQPFFWSTNQQLLSMLPAGSKYFGSEVQPIMNAMQAMRQAAGDRIAEDFSQYMIGVDEYYDPIEERPVELPSGYDNAWTNANGEYIISDNPNYNPNIGSNLNWERMRKK